MTGHPPATHNNRHQVTFGLFVHTFSGGLGTKHPYNYTISHVTHWLYLLLAQFASLLSFLITIMLWKRSTNQHEISHSVGFPSISIFFLEIQFSFHFLYWQIKFSEFEFWYFSFIWRDLITAISALFFWKRLCFLGKILALHFTPF